MSEPYLATVVLGAGLIAEHGRAEQKAALLPKVAEGSLQLALRPCRKGARGSISRRSTPRRAGRATGWVLDGGKIAVLDGAQRDQLIVSARIAANARAATLRLFLRRRDDAGLTHDATIRGSAAAVRCNLDSQTCSCRRTRCSATTARAAGDRGGDRPGAWPRGVRSGRHDADAARHHAGLHQNAQAVRQAAGRQPGDPPPAHRHVDALRRGALDGAARRADG